MKIKIEAGDILKVSNGWEYRIVKYESSYMLFPMNHAGRIIQTTEGLIIKHCAKHEGAELIKNPKREGTNK